jgi:hypothetical protein
MDVTDYIDADEGRETPISDGCYNCGARASNGIFTNRT